MSILIHILRQCIASNLIGFFLYIAAGSMVVWSYSYEIAEDNGDQYKEGELNAQALRYTLQCGLVSKRQPFKS